MDLADAMRTAATVRRYRPDPVPDGVLYRALDSARFAPSGGNRQGWHVIVVRDPNLKRRLQDLYLRTWRPLYETQLAAGRQAPDAAGRRRPGTVEGNHYAEHLHELPVHLVVLVDRAALTTPFPRLNECYAAGSSIYPFVQNLVLALRAEGLGAALTMLHHNEEADLAALLDVPEGFGFAAHLGVGWPAGPHPTRLRRRPVEEFTSRERFGAGPLTPAASPAASARRSRPARSSGSRG